MSTLLDDKGRMRSELRSHERKVRQFVSRKPPGALRKSISRLFANEERIDEEARRKIEKAKELSPAELDALEREIDGTLFSYFAKVLAFLDRQFARQIVAIYYTLKDESTPDNVRAIILAVLAYFILPFDVIPDIIFGIGFTDDVGVLAFAWGFIIGSVKPEHWKAADIYLQRITR